MPLDTSGSKESIGKNITELETNGTPRSHAQIVAIALSTARKGGANIPAPKGDGRYRGAEREK